MNAYRCRQIVVMLSAGIVSGVVAVLLSFVVEGFTALAWPERVFDVWVFHPYNAFTLGFAAAVLLRVWVLRNVAKSGD